LYGQPGQLGPALAKPLLMAEQSSQNVTPRETVSRRCEHVFGGLQLAKLATYIYAAQAAAGFAVGLTLPWVRLLTH
jgi:hypothetical protein